MKKDTTRTELERDLSKELSKKTSEFMKGKEGVIASIEVSVTVKSVEKKPQILVPDNIKLTDRGIWFGGEQELYCWDQGKAYTVCEWNYETKELQLRQYHLVKCERSDLKRGDIALRCDVFEDVSDKKQQLKHYCIIQDDKTIVYVLCGITTSNHHMARWYKCVKV